MKKQYVYNNVTFGFSLRHRKWEFATPGYSFITSVNGGYGTAEKIAHLVHAGLVRTKGKGLDGLARANIEKVNA